MDVKEDNQKPAKQCRIIILLDNSSDEKALMLKRELDKKAKQNKLGLSKALFTIFYLFRHFDLKCSSQGNNLSQAVDGWGAIYLILLKCYCV